MRNHLHMMLKCSISLICILMLLAASNSRTSAWFHASAEQQEQVVKTSKPKKQQKTALMSWDKLHQQFPESFLTHGSRARKRIALTFDVAPDLRFTPAILDILAEHRVCATFFVVGTRAQQQPGIVQRIHLEGHVIGNHSYDHAVMSRLSVVQYKQQIVRTNSIIKGLIGYTPHFIRPPYGELLPSQMKWSQDAGYMVINWDVDSIDWRNDPSSEHILSNISKTLQPGSIVLQHAGGGRGQSLSGTLKALPQLIQLLKSKGYELVTLPELLDEPAASK